MCARRSFSSGATIAALATALIATLGSAAPVFAQEESPALEITRHAEQLVREQKFQEALAEATRAIEADPDFYGAYWVAGLANGNLARHNEARDAFIRAAELRPGWAEAHQMAAVAAFQTGEMDLAWEHAIKAQQGGVDMSQGFSMLRQQSSAPDDLDEQLNVSRVFVVDGVDSTTFQRGGTNTQANALLSLAAGDIFEMQQEARRQLSDSRSFGLVARQDMAQLLMVFEVDTLTVNTSNTRFRGILKLVDAQSGEEEYRRRVDFSDISSRAYLNREFGRVMGLMEEWAAERRR